MADFGRPHRDFRHSYSNADQYSSSSNVDNYDLGYRREFKSYEDNNNSKNNKKQLEIVKGNVFSSNQSYNVATTATSNAIEVYRPSPVQPRAAPRRSNSWFFGDPEMKRRRRVASYKIYSMEGKLKAKLSKGMRWIKGKCSLMVHGH